MKRQILMTVFIVGILINFVLINCDSNKQAATVGAILPLTGNAAILGTEIREGIEIALEEINKGSEYISVIFEDSKNDPSTAVTILNSLTSIRKVKVYISAMSGVSSAIIPIIDKNELILFATVTAKPNLTKLGENVFRFYYTTDIQGEEVVKYIAQVLKKRSLSVLYLNDDYGISGLDYIKRFSKKYNIELVSYQAVNKNAKDHRTQISKIISNRPDIIVVIAYGRELIDIIKQMRELNVNSEIFTYTGIANPEILNNIGVAANGIYLSIGDFNPFKPGNEKQKMFFDSVKKRFNKTPSHYHAFGYDVMKLISKVIDIKEFNTNKMKDNIFKIDKFNGILGNIQINENREIVLKQKIVKIVDMDFAEVQNVQ